MPPLPTALLVVVSAGRGSLETLLPLMRPDVPQRLSLRATLTEAEICGGLLCVDSVKLKSCFPKSSPFYGCGLHWPRGPCVRFRRQKWNNSHYALKVCHQTQWQKHAKVPSRLQLVFALLCSRRVPLSSSSSQPLTLLANSSPYLDTQLVAKQLPADLPRRFPINRCDFSDPG